MLCSSKSMARDHNSGLPLHVFLLFLSFHHPCSFRWSLQRLLPLYLWFSPWQEDALAAHHPVFLSRIGRHLFSRDHGKDRGVTRRFSGSKGNLIPFRLGNEPGFVLDPDRRRFRRVRCNDSETSDGDDEDRAFASADRTSQAARRASSESRRRVGCIHSIQDPRRCGWTGFDGGAASSFPGRGRRTRALASEQARQCVRGGDEL